MNKVTHTCVTQKLMMLPNEPNLMGFVFVWQTLVIKRTEIKIDVAILDRCVSTGKII